jgi:hypothetical protein
MAFILHILLLLLLGKCCSAPITNSTVCYHGRTGCRAVARVPVSNIVCVFRRRNRAAVVENLGHAVVAVAAAQRYKGKL